MGKLIGILAAASLLLAGCGEKAEPGSGGGDVTVTLQAFADPAEAKAYGALIDAFEKANPDVAVKLVPIGNQGDHVAKLTTDFAAGRPADIFLLNYRRFGKFAETKVLEPLGPRLERPKSEFYEQALDAFVVDGVLQCIPQNISTPVVYYNTALFAKAGLDEPEADWTWDDMRAAAQKLTQGAVKGLVFEPSLNRFAPFIWSAGGEVVDDTEKPRRVSLLDPTDRRALRFLTDLQHRYKVVPTMAEHESEDPESRFANQRAGMLIESRRVATALRTVEGLEWDVAPLPRAPGGKPAVMLHSDAYCMAKTSKVKDAAMRFVEFASSPEGAAILARTGRTVPVLKEVAQSDAFLDPSLRPASAQVFLDQIPHIRRFPNIGSWNEIESKADVVVEEWFLGSEPPEALGFEIDIATLELFQPK